MTDRWERLTDLYHAGVALSEDERASLLTESCGDDPALQADVERLIAAHDRANPCAEPPRTTRVATAPGEHVSPPPTEGVPIDAFADGQQLSMAERLHLFIEACSAVAKAHRRGVIHGALKPATILITSDGTPKLIDFEAADQQMMRADDIRSLGFVLDALVGGDPALGSRSHLRDDLDRIVRTALGQDRRRVYGSVDELADDVRSAIESLATRARARIRRRPAVGANNPHRTVLAWVVAGVAVIALGVKVAPLVARRAAPADVVTPTDVPAPSRDRILVDNFADHVGDPALAAALSDAFRTGLTESPSISVLSARPQRAGAVVSGSIDSAGRGYSFTIQLTRSDTGGPFPTLLETAADSADVMRALARLSERLREQLGEPTTSIASTPRLEEVTSPSLPALRAYASGSSAITADDRAAGVRLLQTAVMLDTSFAAAYRVLATTYTEMGDGERAAEALGRAIANQARLPFNTRYHTVASHALTVTASYAAAIDAFNRILERYPNDLRALDGLAVAHAARREYAVQESLLVRAIAVSSEAPLRHTRLTLALVNQGKRDEARRVLDRAEARFPGRPGHGVAEIAIAAANQDWESAEREARTRLDETSTDTDTALEGVETLADIRLTQGRLSDAERDLKRVVASVTRPGGAGRALSAAVRLAYLELRYRRSPAAAVRTMSSALRQYPLARMPEAERPYDEVARLFADAGQPARAQELIAEAARTRLGRSRGADANRHWTLGAIAMAEKHAWEAEIEIHSAAATHPCPVCALPQLARAYEVAGKPDSAIATYERYLRTPWQRRFETDATELGFAMERLGTLYQQQRDNAKAADLYTKLLQLWRGADSELQPLLTDVRRRLEQTGGAAPGR